MRVQIYSQTLTNFFFVESGFSFRDDELKAAVNYCFENPVEPDFQDEIKRNIAEKRNVYRFSIVLLKRVMSKLKKEKRSLSLHQVAKFQMNLVQWNSWISPLDIFGNGVGTALKQLVRPRWRVVAVWPAVWMCARMARDISYWITE